MPKKEFQEKNVKKAVAKACRELNLKAANLDYKIISHGSSGIFGLVGSRKAKILVTLPTAENDVSIKEADVLAPEQLADDHTPLDVEVSTSSEIKPDDAPNLETTEHNDNAGVIEFGQSFLQHLVDAITSDTTISCLEKNKKITYDITGGNSALLIGKHGQTLEALQFLTERAMNRNRDQRLQVEVDVAAYQAKRKGNLIDQAKRMADKADHNGRPVTIGPMSPQDRRVIHITLKSDHRVRTQSNGQGVIRKLTIYPKKRSKRPPRKG